MPKPVYNWKRFWCPRGERLQLVGGYLPDPDGEWAKYQNSTVRTFEQINMLPCLALLGEPDIGKSRAMQSERTVLEAKVQEEGNDLLWLDLRGYSTDVQIVRDLFECKAFLKWSKGNHILYLCLDSLDECLLRVSSVASLLADKLSACDVSRLRFRIACRTADWPSVLESEMLQLWGEKNTGIYELAPLRHKDVVDAIEYNKWNSDTFLAEVERVDAVPLAIKPVTLNLLLKTYRKKQQLPDTKEELYQQGCLLLCSKMNDSRRSGRLNGSYNSNQRLMVSARIAACTILAKKSSIYIGVDESEIDDDILLPREVLWTNQLNMVHSTGKLCCSNSEQGKSAVFK